MNDELKLEITRKKGDSALILSSSRSHLVSRGRRDAEVLAVRGRAEAEFELTPELAIKPFSYLHISVKAERSVEDVQRSAQGGDAESQYLVAASPGRYRFSDQPAIQTVQPLTWFHRAAEQGYAPAQCQLGIIYDPGTRYGWEWSRTEKLSKDISKAVSWYGRAARQGFYEAAFNLGSIYATGESLARDSATAVLFYTKAAEGGLREAQYNLGLMYANGEGVSTDFAEAAKWYLKAAEQGLVEACFNLGVLYEMGKGFAKDSTEAAKWFLEAAKHSYNCKAEFNIGLKYEKGNGVSQDQVEAYRWLHLAAYDLSFWEGPSLDAGRKFVAARDRVSARLTPAEVVEALRKTEAYCMNERDCADGVFDYVEAEKLYRAAAEQGNGDAQFELGFILHAGGSSVGWYGHVKRDYAAAASWFLKAAERGNIDAQYMTGYSYLNGEGVAQDYVQAYFWFSLAASGLPSQKSRLMTDSKTSAAFRREELAGKMSWEQIAKAQEMARESRFRGKPGGAQL